MNKYTNNYITDGENVFFTKTWTTDKEKTMQEYNKNLSLNDIHEVTNDITNSIYRLRKNGSLHHLTDDEFKQIYKLAAKLHSEIAWTILYQNAEGIY